MEFVATPSIALESFNWFVWSAALAPMAASLLMQPNAAAVPQTLSKKITPPFLTGHSRWPIDLKNRQYLRFWLPLPPDGDNASVAPTPTQSFGWYGFGLLLVGVDQIPWGVDGFLVCSLCSPWLCWISRRVFNLCSNRASQYFCSISCFLVIKITCISDYLVRVLSGDGCRHH